MQTIFATIKSSKYNFENERAKGNNDEWLTTFPAHLRDAHFALLLGEEEDSNLRVLFWKDHDPPEIKYLNFTWRDLLSMFSLTFSTKLYEPTESTD